MVKQGVSNRRRSRHVRERKARFYDYNLVFLVIFLVVIGLIMIFSATAYSSENATDFFRKQVFYALLGLVMMIFVSFCPYKRLRKWAVPATVIAAIMIICVKVPGLGYSSHGATRWLNLRVCTIQPAEIAKIAMILYTALIISRIGKQVGKRNGAIMIFAVAIVLFALILFVTNNLSSAIIVFAISFCMYFIAHPKLKPFVKAAMLLVAFVVVLLFMIEMMSSGSGNFRLTRIMAWLHPEDYASDVSYQTLQALYAIGSGGLFGKGLGSSAQKLIMPEAQNDMIFAIVCEELGLFGAMVIILLFILLLYRIVYIASNVKDVFGSMIAIGVFSHIAIQVVLNIAVVTNTIPNTGISLPFISAGGTSLVLLMAEIGVVLNISRNIPYDE